MDVTTALEAVNSRLSALPLNYNPKDLYEPMQDILAQDSPRLYPLLVLWGCYLFSGDYKQAITPSLGTEVFFNFLRLHGDLLEDAQVHNGVDGVPVKWDRNVAILSGDAMIFKAYELLIQVDPQLVKPVVRTFNRCFTRVCEGKQLALNKSGRDPDPDIMRLNPGSLGEFSLQLGAMIGNAAPEHQIQSGRLGVEIAVNFALSVDQRYLHEYSGALNRLQCPPDRKHAFEAWLKERMSDKYL
jgi:geranylgeranyl diphosphate synthase type II